MQKASKYKDGDWKRKSSPTRGEYLEMGDEVNCKNNGNRLINLVVVIL